MIKRVISRAITELSYLRKKDPPQGLRILLYHAVGTPLDFKHSGISIDPDLFCAHMEMIRTHPDFKAIPLDLSALSMPGNPVALTFDDGFKDNLRVAAPILSDLGIPFTVFVVPSYIMSRKPYYLTLPELRELAQIPGCQIGSHGMNHKPLAELSLRSAVNELRDSRLWLEDALARPILFASYPHGSADRRTRQAAADAGYVLAACSRTGINSLKRDPLMLCRTEILASDGPRQFRQKLHGAWDWHRFRRRDPASR